MKNVTEIVFNYNMSHKMYQFKRHNIVSDLIDAHHEY